MKIKEMYLPEDFEARKKQMDLILKISNTGFAYSIAGLCVSTGALTASVLVKIAEMLINNGVSMKGTYVGLGILSVIGAMYSAYHVCKTEIDIKEADKKCRMEYSK